MKTERVEVWIVVDHCGDTAVGKDADEARQKYEEDIQDLSDCEGFRLVKVLVDVPLPEVSTVELSAAVEGLGEVKGGM